MRTLLKLSGICKRFGPTVALDGVDLELREGEVHALIGENGAGKSTLMNLVVGAIRPDSGIMVFNGAPYAPTSPLDARLHGIALVHQELSLCPHLTVWENILLGVEEAHWGWLSREACRRRAREILANFSHPDIEPDRLVRELSIAARQVVEICRALSFEAKIILMDEPTSSLHRADVERLFEIIRRLRDERISVIYISHFLEEIREIAGGYTVLRDGRSVATGELRSTSDEELIAQMVGRRVESLFHTRHRRPSGEVVLEVRNLAAPPALKEVSFELRRGEVLGIAGLMGSGRTPLVRALFGLDPAHAGTLRLGDQTLSVAGATPLERIRQGFAYLSEDRKEEGIALELGVADNITMTRYSVCARWGWLNRTLQGELAQRWMERIGIRAHSPLQPAKTLSGGNQQKVAVARMLHQDADVFLLDEPTRGIDIGSKAQIYQLIGQLAESGKGVLMISSYLPELFGLCDRLAVMSRGRLSPARPIDEWTPETVLQAAIGRAQEVVS